tara:strand:- start:1716 stop:2825 length:1110 start_codon:yes stop_codon:yes gene_type:complete
MNFKINNADLIEALKNLNRVVPNRSTLPILSCVLFSSDGERLNLRATDLEVSLSFSLKSNITEPFNIAIPISKILSICSSLDNEDLNFSISNYKVEIKTEFGEYKIMGQNPEDFPAETRVDKTEKITFNSKKIDNLIDYTISSTSADDLKPSLQGVLFDINEAKVTLVSTDGHKLSKIEHPQNNSVLKKIIIPTKFLKLLQSFLVDKSDLDLVVGENHIQAFFESVKVSTRLINDQYPDYEKVIPKNNENKITVNTKKLIGSLKRVSVFSNKKTKQAVLNIKANSIKISAEDAETAASAKETIICNQEGPLDEIVIAFNGDYLKEILDKTKTEETTLLIKDALSATLIVPKKEENDSNKISLLMPIRLN